MYKALIFDFFDTLAPDFYRVWLERNRYSRTGEFLEVAKAIDRGEISLEEWYVRLSKLSGQPADTIREEFEMKTRLNGDLLQLIDQLRNDYQIGLVTNSPQDLVRKILRVNNIERYFDDIVISGEVRLVKPNPQIFELALQRMNVSAVETIFIDDLPEYCQGAERTGMTTVLFQGINKLKTDLAKLGVTT